MKNLGIQAQFCRFDLRIQFAYTVMEDNYKKQASPVVQALTLPTFALEKIQDTNAHPEWKAVLQL